MFTSSPYNSPTPTTLPFLPDDQTGNPTSSSSPYYYPFPSDDDQTYQFGFDDMPDHNFFSVMDPPNNYCETNSWDFAACFSNEQTPVLQEVTTTAAISTKNSESSIDPFCIDEFSRERMQAGLRVAFRMKTELENVDDGFRWTKYGKKKVKSSPNPRNYYRCSTARCNVKKRVERDRNDSNYVITTYEGVHNHESPSVIHQDTSHSTGEWTFQYSS